jgi:putative hemolysin
MNRSLTAALPLLALSLLAACAAPTGQAALPNPASVFCEQNGGKLDLRTGPGGGVAGICIFPDGSECDEWAYFRGECKPGDAFPGAAPVQAASLTLAALQNAIYHSPDWGDYQLVNGIYHRTPSAPGGSPEAYLTQMIEPTVFGDLNGDGLDDAAVFLSTQTGGTGNFREMAAMINRGGNPDNVSTVSLGDRVVIQAAQIQAGVITLSMRVQGPNDGMCCPSQLETWRFQLHSNSLVGLP